MGLLRAVVRVLSRIFQALREEEKSGKRNMWDWKFSWMVWGVGEVEEEDEQEGGGLRESYSGIGPGGGGGWSLGFK